METRTAGMYPERPRDSRHRVVVVTGMHRSGTSLVASILQKAGINVGDTLVGPLPGNPRGHFEDVDFYHLHERILSRLGLYFLVQDRIPCNCLIQPEIDHAMELVRRRSSLPLWGWKDPRTCLFLDFWAGLIPDARYVFVYRHPLEVVLSLLRRGSDITAMRDFSVGLRSWLIHNRSVLDFYQRHESECFLSHITRVTSDARDFMDRVSRKLDLPLSSEGVESLCNRDELRQLRISRTANRVLRRHMPGACDVYDMLNKVADLPDDSGKVGAAGGIQRRCRDVLIRDLCLTNHAGANAAFRSMLTLLDPESVAHCSSQLEKYIQDLETKNSAARGVSAAAGESRTTSQNPSQSLNDSGEIYDLRMELEARARDLADARQETASARLLLARSELIHARLSREFDRCRWTNLALEVRTRAAGRRLLVWGTGQGGKRTARFLRRSGVDLEGFIDRDPKKAGGVFLGRPVSAPDCLMHRKPSGRPYVIIASIFVRQIGRRLREYGYLSGRDIAVAPLRSYS